MDESTFDMYTVRRAYDKSVSVWDEWCEKQLKLCEKFVKDKVSIWRVQDAKYTVPRTLPGMPSFSGIKTMHWLCEELKSRNFTDAYVISYTPPQIYISWRVEKQRKKYTRIKETEKQKDEMKQDRQDAKIITSHVKNILSKYK